MILINSNFLLCQSNDHIENRTGKNKGMFILFRITFEKEQTQR